MNLLYQTKPWVIMSLLVTASIFGNSQNGCAPKKAEQTQCPQKKVEPTPCPPVCQPIEPICQPQLCKPAKCGRVQEPQPPIIAAYNAPAEINIGFQGEWDFFASGSFLYWQRIQDDMRVATKSSIPLADLTDNGIHGETVDMDSDFQPGFKIGLGMNFRNDDWVGYIEYTRVHGEDETSKFVSSTNPRLFNTWGDIAPGTNTGGGTFIEFNNPSFVFNSVKAEFGCNQDFIDPQLERVYYVGKELVFHSVFGGRIALISEKLDLDYSYNGALIDPLFANKLALPGKMDVISRSTSWAIGPRLGIEMDWMVSHKLRLFGSGFADVLYTRYKVQTKTALRPSVTYNAFGAGNTLFNINRDEFGAIRAHVDFEAGLGWGTYLDYNSWHIDLSASYGFQVFFNQNVLRLPTYSPSNLYVQGLTFTARLDY